MAATEIVSSHPLVVISSIVLLLFSHVRSSFEYGMEPKQLKICGFDAIYNFGDSLSDTGNAIHIDPNVSHSKPPYGKTIRKITGRCSDGLLVFDYLANSAGFPSIKTYLNSNETDANYGVNFAVAGATALPLNVLLPKLNVSNGFINSSFDDQLQWFGEHLKGFCQTDCKEKLRSSLFIIGIGTADYSIAFFNAHKTIEDVKKMGLVSEVVETVLKSIEQVILYGATRVLVPGTNPYGCAPGFIEYSRISNLTHDKLGCLNDFNDFFKYHNDQLQVGLENLRKKYPGVSIKYGDYYNALQSILDNQQRFGIERVTEFCCGYGKLMCGKDGDSPVCSEPQTHIFWDAVHLTQNANKHVADWLIQDIFFKFECKG